MVNLSTETPVPRLLDYALEGSPVSRDDAYRLIRVQGPEIPTLLAAAARLTESAKGRTVAYSRKVFIPLTNLCRDRCGYCTFVKGPKHPDAKTMTPDEVLAVAKAGQRTGCKEALFSLGEKPEDVHKLARTHLKELGYTSMTDYLIDMCRLVYEETGLLPHTNSGVLEPEEVARLREVTVSMGLMLENASRRLLERGQAHFGSIGKDPLIRLETMRYAGEMRVPFTTGMLIGIGETLDERVDTLFAIKDLQDQYGHIQEVIIQNFRAKPDTRMRAYSEPSAVDMAVTIAVARLVLGPDMNIQAPPNLTADSYQFYLTSGINDWGGVSPVTRDFINPEKAWPMITDLREKTGALGYELRERLAIYPEYIIEKPGYLNPDMEAAVIGLVDRDGYVKDEETRW